MDKFDNFKFSLEIVDKEFFNALNSRKNRGKLGNGLFLIL